MEGVAIIKNGPDPVEAKAFVDFVNRKDVREMILEGHLSPPDAHRSRPREPAGRPAADEQPQDRQAMTRMAGPTSARRRLEKIKDLLQESPLSVTGIVIEGVTRTFWHRSRGRRRRSHRRRRRVLHPAGAVGLRQDHLAAHDRRLLRSRCRPDPLWCQADRQSCRRIRATSAWCSRTMPVFPNLTGGGQRRLRAEGAEGAGGGPRATGRGSFVAGPARRATASAGRISFRAASSSGWRSPARW